MSEETRIEGFTTDISGRVTGTHELDAFQTDPLPISSPPKAVLFGELTQESNDSHGAVLIRIGQVDLVAEDYQPFTGLFRA